MRKLIVAPLACASLSVGVGTAAAQTASAAQPTNGASLEEIIVTAQRRSERIQDVPATLNVISSDTLRAASVRELRDLSTKVAGLQMGRTGSNVNPVIRGIGSGVTAPGADTNVAVYIDGVVQPIPAANAVEFNNLERIEVLKGPQGTLYGRNATGGAISIVTRNPSFERELEGEVGYGSYNQVSANAYASVPITDRVALNLAVDYKDDAGFIRNVLSGNKLGANHTLSLRTKLLYNVTDDLSATLSYAHTFRRDSNATTFHILNGNTTARQLNPSIRLFDDRDEVALNQDPFTRASTDQGAVQLKWTRGETTVNSVTSYSRYFTEVYYDGDATQLNLFALDFTTKDTVITQDLYVTTKLHPKVDLLAGLFYYYGQAKWMTNVFTTPFVLNTANRTDSEAAYVELTFHPTEQLSLIAGVRYTQDHVYSSAKAFFTTPLLNRRATFVGWSPRASIRYELDEHRNVYANYSRGFKAGLIDVVSVNPIPVRPEINDAFEVGYKQVVSNFSLNLATYYYLYKDIQVQTFSAANSLTRIQNAGKAAIYGVEGDVSVRLSDQWRVDAGAAYNHARFSEFPNAQTFIPRPGGGNVVQATSVKGRKLPRSPDFTANATVSFTQPLQSGRLQASATGLYNGGFAWDLANRLLEDPYFVLNARVGWTSEDEKYEVSVWGRNLTNKKYSMQTQASALGDTILYAPPLTVGITLAARM